MAGSPRKKPCQMTGSRRQPTSGAPGGVGYLSDSSVTAGDAQRWRQWVTFSSTVITSGGGCWALSGSAAASSSSCWACLYCEQYIFGEPGGDGEADTES